MRGAGEGEGIAHRLVKDRRPFFRCPFPTRKAWRVGYHVLEIGVSVPHSSASPAGQRQKPGCAWLRGVPCSAAFSTLANFIRIIGVYQRFKLAPLRRSVAVAHMAKLRSELPFHRHRLD